MHKIVVRRTSIVINDYVFGDCPTIERMFKLFDPVTHTIYYKGLKYIEEEKKLILPRSIEPSWLERLFDCVAYMDTRPDPFDTVKDIMIKYMPKDDVQKEAFRFTLGVKEYRHLVDLPRQMLALDTGKGKTYIAIGTFAYTGIKTIVIAPMIGWLEQWRDRILEYTDVKPSEICMIQGSSSIGRLLKNGGDKYKIYLASHDTLKSYGDNYGWDKIGELFKAIKVGYKIYDEAHLSFDNICDIDFHTNTYKTFYLTATPGRSDEDENAIYQRYMKDVPTISLFDEVKDPRTQYIAFKYRSGITPQDSTKCINKHGFNKMTYCNVILGYEKFQAMIHIVIDMIKKVNGQTLIYIATNEAIKIIKGWIERDYPEYIGQIGIYTSIIPKAEKEIAKSKQIILSTTKSSGAALDIIGLKMVVQLAEPMKSDILSKQTLGRTRQEHTVYLDIIDMDVPAIRGYYTKRLPLFDKYATKCTEVVFRDQMLYAKANEVKLKNMTPPVQAPPQEQVARTIINPFIHLPPINPFIHLD